MADFGLAAQIGRGGGNAMPGAQPQDQTNRMMQMLQLQQLQQNMMLAREQEGRAARLAPLTETNLQEGINTERARQRLLDPQTLKAGAEASVAQDALSAQRGVLKYISETPKELIADPKNLDVLRRTNAGAYTTITQMIAEKDALEAKARTEKYTAGQKLLEQQAMARRNMFSLLPAITDQKSYDVLYPEYEGIDPTGAKLIGRKFDPTTMAALSSRLMALDESEIKEDAFGNRYRVFKRTGQTEALPPVQPAAQAARRPAAAPESTFGNLSGAFAANPSSPQLVGAGAASLASTPMGMGETPIIQPRTPAPGLGPAATAAGEKATATERAKADVERAEKERDKTIGKESFDKTFGRFVEEYKKLGERGYLITGDTPFGQNLKVGAAAAAPRLAGVVDPRTAPMGTLQNLRQQMVASLIAANPGMSSKSIDSNAELKAYLDSLSTPGQPVETIVSTLNALSEKYGSGKQVTVEDIVGKSAERAPAGRGRGRAPAAPAAPSIEDILKKYPQRAE